jgi:putative copper resistance protein D
VTFLALCRFAHFMATMLAFGVSAYLWLYAPDTLRHALSASVRRLVAASSVIALLTAVVWLALEAASTADDWSAATDPGLVAAVLTDTSFGHAWIARLVLAAALVVAAFARRDHYWPMIVILSALLLASLALVGHAVMQTGAEGVLHRANHAVHLLTAGAWLGGLVPFLLCLAVYADDTLRRDALGAMMSFSFFGQFVVAALVLTGIVNIALVSGHAPFPPATPYRELLDAKIVLVAGMIALALFNRFVVAPRLATGKKALAVLRATSLLEVGLGIIVVALVSVFALLDPA